MPLLVAIATVAVITSLLFIQISVNDNERISYYLGESGHIQLFEEQIAEHEERITHLQAMMDSPDLDEEQLRETSTLLQIAMQDLDNTKTSMMEYTKLKELYEEKTMNVFIE